MIPKAGLISKQETDYKIMRVNKIEIPTEVATSLTEFRKAIEAARKFAAERTTQYVLPEVLRLKAN